MKETYLFGHLVTALVRVEAFIYSFDEVALNSSGLLWTLQNSAPSSFSLDWDSTYSRIALRRHDLSCS